MTQSQRGTRRRSDKEAKKRFLDHANIHTHIIFRCRRESIECRSAVESTKEPTVRRNTLLKDLKRDLNQSVVNRGTFSYTMFPPESAVCTCVFTFSGTVTVGDGATELKWTNGKWTHSTLIAMKLNERTCWKQQNKVENSESFVKCWLANFSAPSGRKYLWYNSSYKKLNKTIKHFHSAREHRGLKSLEFIENDAQAYTAARNNCHVQRHILVGNSSS